MKKKYSLSTSGWFLSIVVFLQTVIPYHALAEREQNLRFNQLTSEVKMKFNSTWNSNAKEPSSSEWSKMQVQMFPGGPDQPETKSFAPIGVSDMVDPFTGSFTYNIPLMDVDGYPLNIAYNGAAGMNAEATWVGLGWSLNPGSITRNMRGMPDDFAGDQIYKEQKTKPELTLGVTGGLNVELFGLDPKKSPTAEFSLGASAEVFYNNYNGYGSTFSLSPSLSLAKKTKGKANTGFLNFSLGLTGSSTNGPSISPGVSISTKDEMKSISIGMPYSSRQGIQEISYGVDFKVQANKTNRMLNKEKTEGYKQNKTSGGLGSSYNMMQSTYMPGAKVNRITLGATFRYKIGVDVFGFDGVGSLGGYLNISSQLNRKQFNRGFGYMYMNQGKTDNQALLDFNRENDGPYTKGTPTIGLPVTTADVFSVAAQGLSGSYIPFTEEIPYTFDPLVTSTSVNAEGGFETGVGGLGKYGIDVTGSSSNVTSQNWRTGNNALLSLGFTKPVFNFREANESAVIGSISNFIAFGGDQPIYYEIKGANSKLSGNLKAVNGDSLGSMPKKTEAFKKSNQLFRAFTIEEVKKGALDRSAQYLNSLPGRKNHHIGAIIVTNTEGKRYVYGIAAYNHKQENYSFATGHSPVKPGSFPDGPDNLVEYDQQDMSLQNKKGVDRYFNKEVLPAHGHSYLLTEILSDNYIDNDGIIGPSKDDFGTYYKFEYNRIGNHKWRIPVEKEQAIYQKGLYGDNSDDKGSVTYGEKELWYVKTIESRNQVAVFHISAREDGYSVIDEHGGLSGSSATSQQKLDSIQLFNLDDFQTGNGIPIKTVHFRYSYKLANGYTGHINSTGKLTLDSLFFTYENQNKGRYNTYVFDYNNTLPYIRTGVDRWGDLVEVPTGPFSNDPQTSLLYPYDEPYTPQNETQRNELTAMYMLKTINLPSGGRIEVDYEANRYTHVQNKLAMKMFKIVGVASDDQISLLSGNIGLAPNARLVAEIGDVTDGHSTNLSDYIEGIQYLYFRSLMKIDEDRYDYVPGYCLIDKPNSRIHVENNKVYAVIAFVPESLRDNAGPDVNPMIAAGLNFARNYLSKFIPPSGQDFDDGEVENELFEVVKALGGSFASFGELFKGPNKYLYDEGLAQSIVSGKSYLRLYSKGKEKLGGGCRVKSVKMFDNWSNMSSGSEQVYGQQYKYVLENGQCSGVAQYEPQIGGEENPFKQPQIYSISYALAPDKVNYQETPFGESFFPSPTVGYSRVEIQSLSHSNINNNSTGKIAKEFYTAKDFPTRVNRTSINRFNNSFAQEKSKTNRIFFKRNSDIASVSQGFVIENNDMHGKPKREVVYAEKLGAKEVEVSSVQYIYRQQESGKLRNDVQVVHPNGNTSRAIRGLNYDVIADFRESKTNFTSGSTQLNINVIPLLIPIPVGVGYFSTTTQITEFRSASVVKTINRFGIQQKTIAKQDGSKVETDDLAYDSETGDVLLTRVNTNYDDPLYSLSIPAHWIYEGMGQAYISGMLKLDFNVSINNGNLGFGRNVGLYPGDEVLVYGNSSTRGWISSVSASSSRIIDAMGDPITANGKLTVVRSGRKNRSGENIATIISRENPLYKIKSNSYQSVLQSSAIEFNDEWNTDCGCNDYGDSLAFSNNPYIKGIKGRWLPLASYSYLTPRTQSFENGNSNIRNDGFFESFNPFYVNTNGQWSKDYRNWTFASKIKAINNLGMSVETSDALNRYTATTYSYRKTLPDAIAVNSRLNQIGAESFEDHLQGTCSYSEFAFDGIGQGDNPSFITDSESHSGDYSLAVPSGVKVSISTITRDVCEETATLCAMELVKSNITYTQDNLPGYLIKAENHADGLSFDSFIDYGEVLIQEYDPQLGGYVIVFENELLANRMILTVSDQNGCNETVEIKTN